MGLILTFLLFLLARTSLMQNENLTCTTIDKSSLVVGIPSYTCSQMIDNLATACGNFTLCAMKYSYPMCLCEACAEYYYAVKQYRNEIKDYDNLPNVTSTREKECEALLLRDDGVEAMERIYNLVISLWDGGNCKACDNYTDEDVQEFYLRVNETLDCWADYIVDAIPIEESNASGSDVELLRKNIVDGKGLNVSHVVCTNCSQVYHSLSSYYDDKYHKKGHSGCADIKQHMEMIRIQWSKSFGCDKPRKDLSIVVCIAIGFAVLIVVFYGGVNFYGYRQEKNEKTIYCVSPSSDRHFETTDSIDHPHVAAIREQTAHHVPRTNIN